MIFLILFFACKKENSIKYIGKWSSTKKPWPYGAILQIKKDNTYSFSGGACTSHFVSIGKWKITNDTLILDSDKIENDICQDDFKNNLCAEIKFAKPDDSIVLKFRCKSKFSGNFINFKHEKFYLKRDSLKHVEINNSCKFKNDFTKKN